MVFSSLFFLYIFLPAALIIYYITPGIRLKNIALTVLSLIFYAWGEPLWVFLLIISACTDYINGRIIGKYRGKWQSKASFVCSIVINLSLLGCFKYGNFIIDNINSLLGLSIPYTGLTLPIGISFYTFQTMSYSIDVYKGEVKVQKSFADFLLFVSLFPQLVAGPILRYSEIEPQLTERKTTLRGFAYGTTRFLIGLGKKVLLSNYASAIVSKLFEQSGGISELTVMQSWLGMILYAFHIYFDFSGYSDMAIGLGHMFGFSYSENFSHPYTSKSITEFWRRWHISLGSFFRDYVYIPLGGNRRYQLRNMLVVWGLTGLWHGASWNFVLWGLYFFVFLALEKYVYGSLIKKLPNVVNLMTTFLIVLFGWVLFYFTDLADVGQMFANLFGFSGVPLIDTESRLQLTNNILLLALCVIGSTAIPAKIGKVVLRNAEERGLRGAVSFASLVVVNTAILFLSTVSLVGSTHNPFIYFRF
jgi:alginate O-acetyltransferase complex protein AlgI